MNNRDHVTVLGVLHIAWSALLFVAAFAVAALFLFGGLAAHDREAAAMIFVIAVVASTLMFVFATAGIIGGVGIMKNRRWARYLLMVLGALWLIKIPVGTALGIYTFYVLTREEIVTSLQ